MGQFICISLRATPTVEQKSNIDALDEKPSPNSGAKPGAIL